MKIINPYRFGVVGSVIKVFDTFTEASDTWIESHTPDIDVEAGGWDDTAGLSKWMVKSATDLLSMDSSSFSGAAVIDAGIADCTITCDLGTIQTLTGIAFRTSVTTNATPTWQARANGSNLQIYEGNTQRDSVSCAATSGEMEIILSGTSITVNFGGSQATYSSSTNQGVSIHGTWSYYLNNTFDNFKVTT